MAKKIDPMDRVDPDEDILCVEQLLVRDDLAVLIGRLTETDLDLRRAILVFEDSEGTVHTELAGQFSAVEAAGLMALGSTMVTDLFTDPTEEDIAEARAEIEGELDGEDE